MIIKQNFKNHFIVTEFIWIAITFTFILDWYLNENYKFLYFSLLFLLFTNIIPSLYLHLRYTLVNLNQSFEILPDDLIITDKKQIIIHKTKDFSKIIINKALNFDENGITFTTMEHYHYVQIYKNNGEIITITCLVDPKIDKIIQIYNEVPIERKGDFFALFKL